MAGGRVKPRADLHAAIERLAPLYKTGKPLSDPLAILVWENVGYLIDDERRGAVFDEFKARIGLDPHSIANAPQAGLSDIAKRGGMAAQQRAGRLREIGRLAILECDGDIRGRLKELPLPKARALLKK